MAQKSGYYVFGDLDIWPMFYFFITRTGHDVLEYICKILEVSVQSNSVANASDEWSFLIPLNITYTIQYTIIY